MPGLRGTAKAVSGNGDVLSGEPGCRQLKLLVLKLEKAEGGEGGQRRGEQESEGDELCEENPAAGRLLLCV